ncbi:hypothetical protein BJY52DRAFT_1114446 [Lactarius psammicola]|nr:hypothetical protein BJY52DRAFT_1114446 [Lactarius psammicola]
MVASSLSLNQAIALPSPSVQNQIHELAKTLPPPRKQNIACDACRQRKVKCHQLPGQPKCQHCIVKNYPCTHHAQQATSERKRISTVNRRPRAYTTTNPQQRSSDVTSRTYLTSPSTPSPQSTPFRYPPATFGPPVRRNTSFTDLLAYLLSPPDEINGLDGCPLPPYRLNPWKDWGELAYKLEDEHFRIEFALDLVEVYFQVVHARLPFLNPTHFRARLNVNVPQYASIYANNPSASGASAEESLHPALMATVIAWGAKFSEHPLLVADRVNSSSRQSGLAKTLIIRSREVAEALKVHRVPAAEHVVIALLIEPLQSQIPEDSSGFRGFWLTSAIRQLFDLQINHKSVISNIQDPEARGTMIFAWWMACLSDAYASAYYRRKPQVEEDDYDVDFYIVDPVTVDPDGQTKPGPREQLEVRQGYYRAAHALARISRHMSKNLWIPTTDSDGVPIEVLRGIMQQLNEWRAQYLPRVGVPADFDEEWDFVSAVSACASDATFHIMWIILFNALDDHGIRESLGSPHSSGASNGASPALAVSGGMQQQINELKGKVLEEALHGALRIAGLAGVLTKNGYLRLDPAAMHVSCNYGGILLARLGRPEVQNCIEGLEQYSYSYEEAADQAQELRRLFALARAGQTDFVHMSGSVGRQQQHPSQHQHHSPPLRRETPASTSLPQPSHSQQSHAPAGLGDSMYVDTRPF